VNEHVLQEQFARIGAALDVRLIDRPSRLSRPQPFTLDVESNGRTEQFILTLRPEASAAIDFVAADVRPADRHLLLLVQQPELPFAERKQKFLCGHDERHWFVATVPDVWGVATVATAMEALKPAAARLSQIKHGVRPKERHDRRNPGYIRQGEWFFLPRPDFVPPDARQTLHSEPIQRSGSKAHLVEWLYRFGGDTVYVCSRFANGLTEASYKRYIQRNPDAARWNWRIMRRNPEVYAMGKVRHPDHKTILLPFWHRVVMSTERQSGNVVFLD
jgi:hypothetical protein